MRERIVYQGGKELRLWIRDDADESVANEIFVYHEYRRAEAVIREATLPIIDVGAHSGFFTLYSGILNPSVPLVAVEPDEENLALLHKHVQKNNLKHVSIVPAAIGATSGTGSLIIAADSHNHRLAAAGEKTLSKQQTKSVAVLSLPDLLNRQEISQVELVKMDIEGGEYAIFNSLEERDYARIRHCILEYHTGAGHTHKELENVLRLHGFGVEIFPSQFDKSMGILWARNKRNT